jgi:hypothetical protein
MKTLFVLALLTVALAAPFYDDGVVMLQSGVCVPRNITIVATEMFEMVTFEFESPLEELAEKNNRTVTYISEDGMEIRLMNVLKYGHCVVSDNRTICSDVCPYTEHLNPIMVDIPYDYFNTTKPVDPISGAHGTYGVYPAVHLVSWEFFQRCSGKPSGWEVFSWFGLSPYIIIKNLMMFDEQTRKFYLKTWEVNRHGQPKPGRWIMTVNATFVEDRRAEGYSLDFLAYDIPRPINENTMKFLTEFKDTLQTNVVGVGYRTGPPHEHIFNPEIGDVIKYNYGVPDYKYFIPRKNRHVHYLLTYNNLPSWYLFLPTTTEQRYETPTALTQKKLQETSKMKIENLPAITQKLITEMKMHKM